MPKVSKVIHGQFHCLTRVLKARSRVMRVHCSGKVTISSLTLQPELVLVDTYVLEVMCALHSTSALQLARTLVMSLPPYKSSTACLSMSELRQAEMTQRLPAPRADTSEGVAHNLLAGLWTTIRPS